MDPTGDITPLADGACGHRRAGGFLANAVPTLDGFDAIFIFDEDIRNAAPQSLDADVTFRTRITGHRPMGSPASGIRPSHVNDAADDAAIVHPSC